MPLRSELLSGSKELQACLNSDAVHVVSGARGEHVALIQSALVRLGALNVEAARAEARFYGPRTAAAVLAYKKEFNIVNRTYQSSADNIVGRMTIASLDHDMSVLDSRAGGPRLAARPGPHPRSPAPVAVPSSASSSANVAVPVRAVTAPVTTVTGVVAFGPPLSELPADMQAVIRRSNDAKKPGVDLLVPYLEKQDGPDEGLMWPDPQKVEQWWAANAARFQKGQRYFMGAPVTWEHCVDVLTHGYQRQRILATHYLCLLRPGTPLFNTSRQGARYGSWRTCLNWAARSHPHSDKCREISDAWNRSTTEIALGV